MHHHINLMKFVFNMYHFPWQIFSHEFFFSRLLTPTIKFLCKNKEKYYSKTPK